MLSNAHARDALIVFEAGSHKYTCAGEGNYISVTTWNHRHFKQFDADAIITKMMANKKTWPLSPYFGKTREEIKLQWDQNRDSAAQLGTAMHYDIECYYTKDVQPQALKEPQALTEAPPSPPQAFLDFVADHPHLKPYRSEWMVFDEDVKIAGSIDMVYEDLQADGALCIYDWKRCKDIKKAAPFGDFALTECIAHLPDTNYWHYALQLNTYKAILEAKYGKKISRLCLVCLHPNLPSYQVITLPNLASEVAALFALRKTEIVI